MSPNEIFLLWKSRTHKKAVLEEETKLCIQYPEGRVQQEKKKSLKEKKEKLKQRKLQMKIIEQREAYKETFLKKDENGRNGG